MKKILKRAKEIPGFPGYLITTQGEVLSLWGRGGRTRKPDKLPFLMRLEKDKDGYLKVGLTKEGTQHKCYVHRLVLETFKGACPSGLEARHKNGHRADNRLENLDWSSHEENCSDKQVHGTAQVGERHGNSILTASLVREARRRKSLGESVKEIAKSMRVNYSTLWCAVRGKTWSHLN